MSPAPPPDATGPASAGASGSGPASAGASAASRPDVLVVGAGPAGRALAAGCAERGLRTRLLDPAPHRPWRATYGAWVDELPPGLPAAVVAARADGVAITPGAGTTRLGREYAVLDVPALRAYLDARLAAAGVDVRRGRAGPEAAGDAAVVIDAGGAAQPLSPRRGRRPGAAPNRGRGEAAEQTAYGVVLDAPAAEPLVTPGRALFMDWRPGPGTGPDDWPTFLYAVPLGGGRVLLEETSLARRPGLPVPVLADRLRARLAGHGIALPTDPELEVVRFRLDTPRHRAPGVLGFGAAAPLTHPATGYQVATALRAAPVVAAALAGAWGRGPAAALTAARRALWPPGALATHALRRRGLEALLRMPPGRVPEFFDGFFALPAAVRADYLGARERPVATSRAMVGLFRTTSWPVRLRLIGFSLLVRAPSGCSVRSSGL